MVVHPFKSMLFGFAFSPTLENNILETSRLAYFFKARLILFHVGEKTAPKIERIHSVLDRTEYRDVPVEIHWATGDPVQTIIEACNTFSIDLLVLGAVQQEDLFTFYVGSIARKLTRKVPCSVMLLIKPSAIRVPCQHVVVNGLDAPDTALVIHHALYAAHALRASLLTIVEEIRPQEVHVTVEDDATLEKARREKERLKAREETRVRHILGAIEPELLEGITVKTQSIFGRRGYSIGHYAEVVRADLLVMNAPEQSGILDRIFRHDIEYILSDLPTDLLIIRPSS